ncbi:hypothetical protein ACT3UQ_00615 [Glutamicibacter sp. AOP12-B1-11]|uniref:hypothetical protein n=1 Tax=Glutamicibacter sp. AOP12-B1-11 TaxID=3457725 RepID=UPI004033C7CE
MGTSAAFGPQAENYEQVGEHGKSEQAVLSSHDGIGYRAVQLGALAQTGTHRIIQGDEKGQAQIYAYGKQYELQ